MADAPLRKLSKYITFSPLQEMGSSELRQAGADLVLGEGVKDVEMGLVSEGRGSERKLKLCVQSALPTPF